MNLRILFQNFFSRKLHHQDYWDRELTGSTLGKLYYASGTSTIASRGKFSFQKNGQNFLVTGTVEFHWWDPYDWHDGLDAYILGHGVIEDGDALKLENNGYGKAYKMYSFWYKGFSATYGIDKGIFKTDTWNYNWKEPAEGRAPTGLAGSWHTNHDTYTDSDGRRLPGLPSPVR